MNNQTVNQPRIKETKTYLQQQNKKSNNQKSNNKKSNNKLTIKANNQTTKELIIQIIKQLNITQLVIKQLSSNLQQHNKRKTNQ